MRVRGGAALDRHRLPGLACNPGWLLPFRGPARECLVRTCSAVSAVTRILNSASESGMTWPLPCICSGRSHLGCCGGRGASASSFCLDAGLRGCLAVRWRLADFALSAGTLQGRLCLTPAVAAVCGKAAWSWRLLATRPGPSTGLARCAWCRPALPTRRDALWGAQEAAGCTLTAAGLRSVPAAEAGWAPSGSVASCTVAGGQLACARAMPPGGPGRLPAGCKASPDG